MPPSPNAEELPSDVTLSRGRAGRVRQTLFHLGRVALFGAIVWLIRDQHTWYMAQQDGQHGRPVSLEQVKAFFPNAARLADWDAVSGGQVVENREGLGLGYVLQTSPKCDNVVGYSGPTNVLIALDKTDHVLGTAVLSSRDTPEHVKAVLNDPHFLHCFDGKTRTEVCGLTSIDGVSGATLTSMAIAESVVRSLGGNRPSFLFSHSIDISEVQLVLPNASQLVESNEYSGLLDVRDDRGQRIGRVARTAPEADNLIGFSGPTDTLIVLDRDDRVKALAIRESYDSSDWVMWVAEDKDFMGRFQGMSLQELATLDLREAQIEGVSGATMTSITIAEGLVKAAQEAVRRREQQSTPSLTITGRDVGTTILIGLAALVAMTHLRGLQWVRIVFQLVLILYLGFINGDMVSQALLVGWAETTVPWRFAPGLTLLTAAAFLVPLTSHRQLYCHYLCPHGAAQELLRNRLPWRIHLPRNIGRYLKFLPAILLAWVLFVTMRHFSFDLTSLEPFNAYMIRIAGWATITVAVVGLVASLFLPMAYCRFGCPTGALLNYLRWNARSGDFSSRDLAAILFLVAAILMRWH